MKSFHNGMYYVTVQANKTIEMQPHPHLCSATSLLAGSTACKVSLFAASYSSHLMLVSNLIGTLEIHRGHVKSAQTDTKGAADS